jgi:hypothetical protein
MSTKKFTTRHGIDANYQDIVSANNVSTNTLTALVSTGTPPLTVSSTTKVENLNVDLLDGYNTATSNAANTVVVRDANSFISLNGLYMNSSEGLKNISWNNTYSTYDMELLNGVTLQVGQESHIYGRATETIQNGKIVMFAGAQGDGLLLRLANTQVTGFEPRWIVGVATQTIPQNNWGYVTWFGKVNDVDTYNYSLGDILYLDNNNPGAFSNTRPTAPDYAITLAAVVRVSNSPSSNNGILMVRPDFGYELSEARDVKITNISANDVIIWSANNRWENKPQSNLDVGNSDKLDGEHGSYYTGYTDTANTNNLIYTNNVINSNVTLLQGINTTQNTNISNLTSWLSSNVSLIAGVDNTQNTNILSIQEVDNTQNTRLTVIEGVDVTQNTNISNLTSWLSSNVSLIAGVDNTQNTRLTVIEGVDVTQNTFTQAAFTHANAAFLSSNTKFSSSGGTITGDVVITGNVAVQGTTTTLDVDTIAVEDKNITLANVASPTNITADGGGITVRGTTDKTWNWINATSSWTSSENIDIASGKTYKINGIDVLTSTTISNIQGVDNTQNTRLTVIEGTDVTQNTNITNLTSWLSSNNTLQTNINATQNTSITAAFIQANSAYNQANTTNTNASNASNLTTGTIPGDRGVTAGSTTPSFIEYNGTTKTAGQFDGGSTAPTNTTRLNYDGNLYATTFYGEGTGLTGTASNLTANVANFEVITNATSGTYYPQLVSATSGTLAGYTNNAFAFDVANGRFGIATTTPTTKLHITESAGACVPILTLDNSSGWATGINFKVNYSGYTTSRIVYDFYGSEFAGLSHGMNYVSGRPSNSNHWFRDSANNIQLAILNSGNVVIGSNTTNYKFEVVGTAKANTLTLTANTASTNTTTGTLVVTGGIGISGALNATTKSFDIVHPSDPNKRLRYGSLESPYHGVRLTGKGKVINGKGVVTLPYYFRDLVHEEDVNIQLTNIKHGKVLWVEDINIKENRFTVGIDETTSIFTKEYEFFWDITAERKDVPSLIVEE